ncbi:hypothetical protein L5F24_07545 [Aliarcobacter butzleri]|uniref:radical SAM protein n=1 Tax=Aliarcobacter butzleri TaxID=28197 RepID=UPI001EDA84E8|nr:radical SAM protein [Aliarcobacter butzleri]MCG3667855.1 hypothetical protein [Aliarcobacter butzleri]
MKNANNVFLSLTTRCNIRCEKCWRFDIFGNGHDAKDEVLEKFFELFYNYKGRVIIGSGENLISKGIEKYINWATLNSIKTTILTNGLVFNKFFEKPKFFSQNIKWGLTMDGFYNQEINNLQTGLDIEKVKSNIVEIKKRYPNSSFYINITHTKNNLKSTLKFIEFANSVNIKEVYFTQLKLFEGLDDTYTKDQVNDFKSKEFIEKMKQAKILAKKLNIYLYAPLKPIAKDCFADIKSISPIIHGNGNIIFCYGKDGDIIGNILNNNGNIAWRQHLDKLSNSIFEKNKWCEHCNTSDVSERGYYYIPGQKR